jgi:hypothetical protein
MSPEVSKLLEQVLALSIEEQEALAESLISSLGGKVDAGAVAVVHAAAPRLAPKGRARTWGTIPLRGLATHS